MALAPMNIYHWGMLILALVTAVVTVARLISSARHEASESMKAAKQARATADAAHKRVDATQDAIHLKDLSTVERITRVATQVENLSKQQDETRDAVVGGLREVRQMMEVRLERLEVKVDSVLTDGCARACPPLR
jgi:cell division protein FtsL